MSWSDRPRGCGRILRRAAAWLTTTAVLTGAAAAQTTEPPAAADPLNPFNAAPTPATPMTYGLPAAPAAPAASARPPLFITPSLGLQEQFTDNALLTETNRQSDFVTRGLAGVSADVNLGRLQGSLSGQVAYDWYANESSLNGKSLSGAVGGSYSLLPERLWIEANGVVTNGYVTSFGESAVSRSGVNGRNELATYSIGPKLTAPLGGFADLGLAATFGQVFYSDNGTTLPLALVLPSDDNIVQVEGRLDTGQRLGAIQLLTTAQLARDNHGYHTANGVESVYFAVSPRLRLVARAGYERLYQSGEVDISSPLLSAGVEIRPNADSLITLEGGERYKHTAWAAEANYAVTPRITFNGYYREAVEPDQLFVAGSIAEFVAQMASLPALIVPTMLTPQQNLYNQASFSKNGGVRLAWRTDVDQLTFAADWLDRRFFTLTGADRSLTGYVTYDHKLRPDLTLAATARFAHTYASPLYAPNEHYGGSVGLTYQMNSTSNLVATYAHSQSRQLVGGGLSFAENVIVVAIQKRF